MERKEKVKKALLLHGGGLFPMSCRKLVKSLSETHQVTVPVLDGHPGAEHPFTTIKDNADHMISLIDSEMEGHVDIITGLSLGAQIALEIISKRRDIATSAIIESANLSPSLIPSPFLKSAVRMSWPLTKYEWFNEARFSSLHLPAELYDEYSECTRNTKAEDAASFIAARVKYELKSGIRETSTDIVYIYGGKEPYAIRRSALKLKEMLPDAEVMEIPGLRHGEASVKLHCSYLEKVREALE